MNNLRSLGNICGLFLRALVDASRNEVLRYNGVDSDPVNWGWLCDKGRFDFQALNHEDRLATPLLRAADGGELQVARWGDAMAAAADAIQQGLDRSGPTGLMSGGDTLIAFDDQNVIVLHNVT